MSYWTWLLASTVPVPAQWAEPSNNVGQSVGHSGSARGSDPASRTAEQVVDVLAAGESMEENTVERPSRSSTCQFSRIFPRTEFNSVMSSRTSKIPWMSQFHNLLLRKVSRLRKLFSRNYR